MSQVNFTAHLEKFLKLNKPKIAFGLKEPDKEIIDSLKKSTQYAEIVLVGPVAIKDIVDLPVIVDENPEEKIAHMLVEGEVDGIIRGTIDDFKTYEAYTTFANFKGTVLEPAIMEDPLHRQFILTPCSNPEGWDKEDRFEQAKQIAEVIKSWRIEPKIAVFTAERHETYPRKKQIKTGVVGILNKTYEDAEWIVKKLKETGFHAKNWAIDLNPAVEEGYNLLIPVNGMVGNQIFRVLLFCGGKLLAAPRIGTPHPYEDNSRTEKDFEPHVKFLVANINKVKK